MTVSSQQQPYGTADCIGIPTDRILTMIQLMQIRLVTRMSCVITIFHIALYKVASWIATSICNVFYDLIVDPI